MDEHNHSGVEPAMDVGNALTLTRPKFVVKVIRNDGNLVDCQFSTKSAMKELDKLRHKRSIADKLMVLAGKLKEETGKELVVHHELVMPNKQIYRAFPHYQNKPWYDWALFSLNLVICCKAGTREESAIKEMKGQEEEELRRSTGGWMTMAAAAGTTTVMTASVKEAMIRMRNMGRNDWMFDHAKCSVL
jgi:hypothetical protein